MRDTAPSARRMWADGRFRASTPFALKAVNIRTPPPALRHTRASAIRRDGAVSLFAAPSVRKSRGASGVRNTRACALSEYARGRMRYLFWNFALCVSGDPGACGITSTFALAETRVIIPAMSPIARTGNTLMYSRRRPRRAPSLPLKLPKSAREPIPARPLPRARGCAFPACGSLGGEGGAVRKNRHLVRREPHLCQLRSATDGVRSQSFIAHPHTAKGRADIRRRPDPPHLSTQAHR